MALELRRHAQPAHLGGAPRRNLDELDGRAEVVERHGEAGRRLLQPEGPLEDAVAAVDADARAAHVGRPEKREAHDVVPMHVRHEDVDRGGTARLAREHVLAEGARAASHVADEVLLAPGLELHARRMAAEGVAHGEGQRLGSELVRLAVGGKAPALRRDQRPREPVADVGGGESDGDRAARTPEAYAHRALSPGRRRQARPAKPRRAPRASCYRPAAPG